MNNDQGPAPPPAGKVPKEIPPPPQLHPKIRNAKHYPALAHLRWHEVSRLVNSVGTPVDRAPHWYAEDVLHVLHNELISAWLPITEQAKKSRRFMNFLLSRIRKFSGRSDFESPHFGGLTSRKLGREIRGAYSDDAEEYIDSVSVHWQSQVTKHPQGRAGTLSIMWGIFSVVAFDVSSGIQEHRFTALQFEVDRTNLTSNGTVRNTSDLEEIPSFSQAETSLFDPSTISKILAPPTSEDSTFSKSSFRGRHPILSSVMASLACDSMRIWQDYKRDWRGVKKIEGPQAASLALRAGFRLAAACVAGWQDVRHHRRELSYQGFSSRNPPEPSSTTVTEQSVGWNSSSLQGATTRTRKKCETTCMLRQSVVL